MGLSSGKTKVSIEEFCQQFYDSQIFHPVIAGQDASSLYMEEVFNFVVEADQSFAAVDKTVFKREMIALRIELFGLAFMHHVKKDEHLLAQSVFTRNYLEQNGQLEIWNIMPEYNKAIAASSTEIVSGVRMKRGWTAAMNKMRFDMFVRWENAGVDPECAVRVSNRLGTEVAWEKHITIKHLTARLADRLGCDVNLKSEALFRLGTAIFGLYNGAKEAVKSVNLQVS